MQPRSAETPSSHFSIDSAVICPWGGYANCASRPGHSHYSFQFAVARTSSESLGRGNIGDVDSDHKDEMFLTTCFESVIKIRRQG